MVQNKRTLSDSLKYFFKQFYYFRLFILQIQLIFRRIKICGISYFLYSGCKIIGNGCYKLKKDIIGKGNIILIKRNSFIKNSFIRIRGNNNKLLIEEDCIIGRNCSFWLEGNNCRIILGRGTSMTRDVQVNCQENETRIIIGKDCMLSNNIIIRTSDSHPIFDINTGHRLNNPKSVYIGNHVWIAPNTKIMKGAHIEDNCVIGSDTTVSCLIPASSLAVGRPAKVVRHDIIWTRDSLF